MGIPKLQSILFELSTQDRSDELWPGFASTE